MRCVERLGEEEISIELRTEFEVHGGSVVYNNNGMILVVDSGESESRRKSGRSNKSGQRLHSAGASVSGASPIVGKPQGDREDENSRR